MAESCKSLTHTFYSFIHGECLQNIQNATTTNKVLYAGITLVASVATAVLIGYVPVIGAVLSVPSALIVGMYTFARLTQPDPSFFNRAKFPTTTFRDLCRSMKSPCQVYGRFSHLDSVNKKAAILIATAVSAVCVGIIIGSIPVLGSWIVVPAALIVGLATFTYLTHSQMSKKELEDDRAHDATDASAGSKLDVAADTVGGILDDAVGGVKRVLGKGQGAPGAGPESAGAVVSSSGPAAGSESADVVSSSAAAAQPDASAEAAAATAAAAVAAAASTAAAVVASVAAAAPALDAVPAAATT